MSSNHRITDNAATVAGPSPSTNGTPSSNGTAHKPQDERSDSRGSSQHHPSPNGSGQATPTNGRDDFGRYTPGNPGGPGNPFARLVAELRKAAIEAVPREKLRAIFVKMSDLAVEGNVHAANSSPRT